MRSRLFIELHVAPRKVPEECKENYRNAAKAAWDEMYTAFILGEIEDEKEAPRQAAAPGLSSEKNETKKKRKQRN